MQPLLELLHGGSSAIGLRGGGGGGGHNGRLDHGLGGRLRGAHARAARGRGSAGRGLDLSAGTNRRPAAARGRRSGALRETGRVGLAREVRVALPGGRDDASAAAAGGTGRGGLALRRRLLLASLLLLLDLGQGLALLLGLRRSREPSGAGRLGSSRLRPRARRLGRGRLAPSASRREARRNRGGGGGPLLLPDLSRLLLHRRAARRLRLLFRLGRVAGLGLLDLLQAGTPVSLRAGFLSPGRHRGRLRGLSGGFGHLSLQGP